MSGEEQYSEVGRRENMLEVTKKRAYRIVSDRRVWRLFCHVHHKAET